jgi:hypothetical protein
MDVKQKQFLDNRFKEYAKTEPGIKPLKAMLLKLGGEHVVSPMNHDSEIPRLNESGFLMNYPVTVKLMEANMCHLNSVTLFATGKATAYGTGFALTGDDGLWRQHSWAIKRQKDGTLGILETTGERDLYFGVLYWGLLGKMFAKGEFEFNGVKPPAELVAELDNIQGAAVEPVGRAD